MRRRILRIDYRASLAVIYLPSDTGTAWQVRGFPSVKYDKGIWHTSFDFPEVIASTNLGAS